MSYPSYSPYASGDAVSDLADVFQNFEDSLNDLPTEAIPHGAIRGPHVAANVRMLVSATDYAAEYNGSDGKHEYTEGTELVNAGSGEWNTVGDTTDASYTGGEMEVDFGSGIDIEGVDSTDDGEPVRAILVLANVEVQDIADGDSVGFRVQAYNETTTSWETAAVYGGGQALYNDRDIAGDGSGEDVYYDVPITAIIYKEPGSLNDYSYSKVRVQCQVSNPGTGVVVLELLRWSLVALPLRCSLAEV